MGKSKKRQRATLQADDAPNKKRKLKHATTPSDVVTMPTDSVKEDAVSVEVDPYDAFTTTINEWIQNQSGVESMLQYQLLEESTENDADDEMREIMENLEVPMQEKLRGISRADRTQCFKFECEWKKCVFLTGNVPKYYRHVERHARALEEQETGIYECEWDLCDFRARDHYDFVGHVHFHAYHTQMKVHGASMSMLMKFPACNFDSRTRNNISDYPTRYTCEWGSCGEKFNKALIFFHHVHWHVLDMFPPGKKSLPEPVQCCWAGCEYKISKSAWGIEHSMRHTHEKTIGCFNCGAMQVHAARLRGHCQRQLEAAYRRKICDECDKSFATTALLRAHQAVHRLKYSCTLCPRKCVTPSLLATHIRRVHLKTRTASCSQCEYKTFSKQELDSHVTRNHTTRQLLRCDEFGCNATFLAMESLKKHIAQHYNIPPQRYACHICTKEYGVGYRLTKHLLFEHDLKRAPGELRIRYKLDADGAFRLPSYVESQRKRREAALNKEKLSDSDDSDGDARGHAKDGSDSALAKDTAAAVKTKINKISMIGQHEIAIDLGFDRGDHEVVALPSPEAPAVKGVFLKKEKRDSPKSHAQEESRLVEKKQEKKTKKPKKVQEFTVMQRYLKTGKLKES